MKKLFCLLMTAVLLMSAACALAETAEAAPDPEAAPDTEAEIVTAAIGDVTFAFVNEGEYYEFSYLYPAEFELEIKEDTDRVRHALRYYQDPFDKTAVGVVIARNNSYATPEERVESPAFIDKTWTEEINGVPWAVGAADDNSVIMYACAGDGYIYTFSFSTEYEGIFDFADFAKTFVSLIKPVAPAQ